MQALVEQVARRRVLRCAQLHVETQTILPLAVPQQFVGFVVHHVVHRGPLERGEHVILVGGHKFVGRRHHVARVVEGEVVHRKLAWQIGLFVERIGYLAHAFPLFVLKAVGYVALEKQMLVKVGRGLGRSTQAQPVNKVVRYHGVDRTDVYLRRLVGVHRCFYKVLNKCLGHPQHGFEALHAFELLDELFHCALALGERVGTVLLPKMLVLHLCIGRGERLALELEGLVGNGFEGKVAIFGVALYLEFAGRLGDVQLHKHVVLYKHLLAGGQLVEGLNDAHALHKVHIAAHGYAHVGLVDAVSAIGHDVKTARKPEVLRIVRGKVHLYAALFAVYHQRVYYKVAVKRYGRSRRYRTGKGVLQQAHLVIVDVYIGKAVLQHGVDNVTRVEQVVDAV